MSSTSSMPGFRPADYAASARSLVTLCTDANAGIAKIKSLLESTSGLVHIPASKGEGLFVYSPLSGAALRILFPVSGPSSCAQSVDIIAFPFLERPGLEIWRLEEAVSSYLSKLAGAGGKAHCGTAYSVGSNVIGLDFSERHLKISSARRYDRQGAVKLEAGSALEVSVLSTDIKTSLN